MDDIKLIFLDFHGVMTDSREIHTRKSNFFDRNPMKNLNKLIRSTDAKVVVTSTHRIIGLSKIQELLKKEGLMGDVIGITPTCNLMDRGYEIEAYVEAFKKLKMPVDNSKVNPYIDFRLLPQSFRLKQYVILDDLNISYHDNNFVKINSWRGLEAEDAREAYHILSN